MVTVTRLTLVKLLELILVCIILGLHYNSAGLSGTAENMLAMGTFGGYLIILVGLFAGGIMGTPVNRRVDLFFSLVGCILFLAAGSIIVDYNKHGSGKEHDTQMAKGSLAIIEGIFFFVDAILTFRGEA